MDLSVAGREPLKLAVSLDAADACFNGHFPGDTVVPGTLIVSLCLEAARRHLGRSGALTVRRFSFSRFAAPGSYELLLEERQLLFMFFTIAARIFLALLVAPFTSR